MAIASGQRNVKCLTILLACIFLQFGVCHMASAKEQISTAEETCKIITNNATLKSAITKAQTLSTACPCTQNVAELDVTFYLTKSCYENVFFHNTVKQRCCYDRYGQLISRGPQGGYIIVEHLEQEIRIANQMCCIDSNNCEMFNKMNPPDDCSNYKPSHSVKSWGDPLITTLDGHKFAFNGHGEYIFLLHIKTNRELQIQARTDYQFENNNDTTVFTAFVITARHESKDDLLSVFLNKTASGISLYTKNVTPIQLNKAKQSELFMVFQHTKDTALIQIREFPLFISMSHVSDLGLGITLTIRPPDEPFNGTGLAGNAVGNYFIDRNGEKYSINSTEYEIFNYSETWSLGSASESNFNYNLSDGNFSLYNNQHTTPRFLETLTGNLTELFKGWDQGNITIFNHTCYMHWLYKVSTECLLNIARSGRVETGAATVNELGKQYNRSRETSNRPPEFTKDMITHLLVNYSDVEPFKINLSDYVKDANNDTLTFLVDTNINKSEYMIDNKTGEFSWNVSGQARNETIQLTFLVRDDFTKAAMVITITYCGCEDKEQCGFKGIDNTEEKFSRLQCTCKGRYTDGEFCETRINPCDITNCTFEDYNITCDNSSNDDNPCGPCPVGYDDSFLLEPYRHQTCTNIDECNLEDPCDHLCNDTEGSFECSCYKGFRLNTTDMKSCIDVDECQEGTKTCNVNEVCSDPKGNATCLCAPGYKRQSGENNFCEKTVGYTYAFTMTLVPLGSLDNPDTTDTRKQARKAILDTLNGTIELLDVIITRIYYEERLTETRRKRGVGDSKRLLRIDYNVLIKEQTTYKKMEKNLTSAFQSSEVNFEIGNTDFEIPENFTVKKREGGSCSQGDDCDERTSHCADDDGLASCKCNEGFAEVKQGEKYCRDKDECKELTNMTDICFGGKCTNLFDGWNCTCPSNTTWSKVGNKVYPYTYRCQGNHSYIGNISFYHADTIIWTKSNVTDYFDTLFKVWLKNETTNITTVADPPLIDLYLTTKVFNLNTFADKYHRAIVGYWYTFSYILTLGQAVNVSRIQTVFQHGNGSGHKPTICTDKRDDCKIFNMSFYDDTDDILCNLGNKCDTFSTICSVSKGQVSCECKDGFEQFDDYYYSCRDFDECSDNNTYICLGGGSCRNLPLGNWTCDCPEGYEAIRSDYHTIIDCTDIDECITSTCIDGNCTNTVGSWSCTCEEGFFSVNVSDSLKRCEDVDECSNNFTCGGGGTCTDLPFGNWTCVCPTGYEAKYFSYHNITCSDIDECAISTSCDGNCTNTEGSWKCTCEEGFFSVDVSDSVKRCEDVKECNDSGHFCLNNGSCRELSGNWTCDCPSGYSSVRLNNTHMDCIDIEECNETELYTCVNGQCKNEVGNWSCECNKGFQFDYRNKFSITCKDINECHELNYTCNNGHCINSPGSWNCTCDPGHRLVNDSDNVYRCIDIDECAEDEGYHCKNSLGCWNDVGSWSCICAEGERPKTLNMSTKICEGGQTYIFNVEVFMTSEDHELQTNVTALKSVLQKKIKQVLKDILKNVDFDLSISQLNEVSEKLNTYDVAFWVRLYNDTVRQHIVTSWNSSVAIVCQDSCTEMEGKVIIRIVPKLQDGTPAINGDICDNKEANPCKPATTACEVKDGAINCQCKAGYEKKNVSKTSCQDVNECKIDDQCKNGKCLNSPGSFHCDCPVGLDSIVKDRNNISICSGSTAYHFKRTIEMTRKLNTTEKENIETKLKAEMECIYADKIKDAHITVIVTIKEFPRSKREVSNATHYELVTDIHSNSSEIAEEISDIQNETTDSIIYTIENVTHTTNVTVGDQHEIQPETTTVSTLTTTTISVIVTPTPLACSLACENGGTCVIVSQSPTCRCATGFIGNSCEVKSKPNNDKEDSVSKTILYAISGTAAGVIVILAIVIVVVCRNNRSKRQKKSRKGDNMSMSTISNNFNKFSSHIYLPQDNRSIDVDRPPSMYNGQSISIPRVDPFIYAEPKPDYNPPPVSQKPVHNKTTEPKPDYYISGSPQLDHRRAGFRNSDYEPNHLMRTTDSSRDSGVPDITRASLGMDYGQRQQVANPVYAVVNRGGQPGLRTFNHM